MEKLINYKPEGGKLLRIKVKLDGNVIKEIKIYGDFFIHPEEKINEIESFFINKKIEELKQHKTDLDEKIRKERIELIGITTQSIIEALSKIFKK